MTHSFKRLALAALVALASAVPALATTQSLSDMSDTWNDAGTTFAGIKLNVTDTASASASLLIDLQVGAASRFKVSKAGVMTLAAEGTFTFSSTAGPGASDQIAVSSVTDGFASLRAQRYADANNAIYAGDALSGMSANGYRLGSGNALQWTDNGSASAGTSDIYLFRDAAGTLAQRNSTNAQAFRVYNTFTDASNYERLNVAWASNVVTITPAEAGTGSERGLIVGTFQTTATVDGATTFAVTGQNMLLVCTGAETINTITGGVTGMILTLTNSDTECTIADDDDATAANAIDLTGAGTNDVGAVAKVISLMFNGSHWLQVSESDN